MSDHGDEVASVASSKLSQLDGPDLSELKAVVNSMKDTIITLAGNLDSLGGQTARVAALKPEIDTAHKIKHIRQKLKSHEIKQDQKMEALKYQLEGALKDKIAEEIRLELGKTIAGEVEKQVRDEVTRQMAIHIPILMEKQNKEHRRQIIEIRKNLHNSEARRANSLLKSNNLFDPLHPLLRPNGEKCSIFPKTLASVFSSGPEVSKLLCTEFSLPETDSKESNLNRFLHHIGVGFQMVATPMSSASDGQIIAGE